MAVNSKHPAYEKMLPKWKRCRDASEGQDSIHAAGVLYLPKLSDQTDPDYEAYKLRATFFNATWRTIAGLQGMLFRKPPVVNVAASVTPLLDAITEDGQPLRLLALEIVEECLTVGRVGVMIDFPLVNQERLTQADAQLLNLRPTMAIYKAESIINWKVAKISNQQKLVRVVLEECELEEDDEDEFAAKSETKYRVLDLTDAGYRVRLFEAEEGAKEEHFIQIGDDIYPTMNGKPLRELPFYILGTDDATVHPDEPPLIDLVDVNIAHYRTSADYEHGCHFTGLPTGYICGHTIEQGEKIYLGSQTMLVFPSPETKVGFLEFGGNGLGALEKNLERKEAQMAILGARMLEAQKKAVEAADTAALHRAGENSLLASIAQAISLSMTRALQMFSDWAGSTEPVEFVLNRDFFPAPMDAPTLTALVSSWQYGAISKETLFENLQQAEIISETRTFEDEQTKISDSMVLTTPGA